MSWLSAIASLALVAACTPDTSSDSTDSTSNAEPTWVPIASVYAWTETPAADDPFAQLRPANSTCAANGHGLHDLGGDPSYEINTGTCNYLSISQAALQELKAGTSIEFRVWHFDLDTALDDAGEAYLALDIGGHLVFERTVPIPSTAELITGDFDLPVDVSLGDPITVHLHNHGANTWNVLSLEALVSSGT